MPSTGRRGGEAPIRFFAFSRGEDGRRLGTGRRDARRVDRNPIMEEFEALYDRERRLFYQAIEPSEVRAVPKTFDEEHLRFRFDDSWFVIKYDEHRDYRERIERLDETKAVDFVAVQADSRLYLIEVKDFRGHRIENQERLRESELGIEVGQKVRDTIAGIVAAYHRGNEEDWAAGRASDGLSARRRSTSCCGWSRTFLPAPVVAGRIKHRS